MSAKVKRAGGSRRVTTTILAATAIVFAACHVDSTGPTSQRARPVIVSAVVSPNSHNVLSAVVNFSVRNADSVRVTGRALSETGTPDSSSALSTPFQRIGGAGGTVVLLGLRANTDYAITLEVDGVSGADTAALSFHSAGLPDALSGLELRGVGAQPAGYTLTDFTSSSAAYMVAFDGSGRLSWYREFPTQPGESALDAEQQSNGHYVLYVGASTGWQPKSGRYFEVNAAGDSVRTWTTGAPYYTDPHELRLDFRGDTLVRSLMLGYDMRTVDLTSLGGLAAQQVAGHVLVRQNASGEVDFVWNAWDHFTIADWLFIQPGLAKMASIDFDHPNSIDEDEHGNYIISFASLGEITKIDGATGGMLWRFGGRHNQFAIIGDPLNGFGIQHDVRLLPNGNLLLLDNGVGHVPQESRAVEYKLDPVARTARMVWQYRHTPALFAPFAGSAQRLKTGTTVVAFGAASHISDVTAAGAVSWEADLLNRGLRVPYLYRARRLGSLYQPVQQ